MLWVSRGLGLGVELLEGHWLEHLRFWRNVPSRVAPPGELLRRRAASYTLPCMSLIHAPLDEGSSLDRCRAKEGVIRRAPTRGTESAGRQLSASLLYAYATEEVRSPGSRCIGSGSGDARCPHGRLRSPLPGIERRPRARLLLPPGAPPVAAPRVA
jgi:hypothetical protein